MLLDKNLFYVVVLYSVGCTQQLFLVCTTFLIASDTRYSSIDFVLTLYSGNLLKFLFTVSLENTSKTKKQVASCLFFVDL